MSKKPPARLLAAAVLLAAVLIFTVACSIKKANNAKNSSNITSASESSSNEPETADYLTHINVEVFHPITEAVDKTFFEDINDAYEPHKISGTFDFDGDGKIDTLTVNFPQTENGSDATTITIGKSSIYEHFLGLAGVYSLKLNEKDKENVLCLVEYNTDNYIYSHFYGYKNGAIVSLGEVDGSFAIDKTRQPFSREYNEQILVDDAGRIIPRYALAKFISPNIVLNISSYSNDKITKMPLDANAYLSEEYTVSADTKPFFEEGNYNSQSYIPKCNENDILHLKKGEKLKLINISSKAANQEAAVVRLQSGKQGLLYYFLSP